MSDKKRKFFSGRSVEQAVMAAASHYGIAPDELAYREIEKKHGFVRVRRNAVIAVDPENPRKAAGGERAAAPAKETRREAAEARSEPSRERERQDERPARRDREARHEREDREERRDAEEREEPQKSTRGGRQPGRDRGERDDRGDRDEREAGKGRDDRAASGRDAEAEEPTDDEKGPTPGWWHAPKVEREEDEDDEETRREPVRRVDPSRGLTRRRHDADEEPPRERLGGEGGRRSTARPTESEEETRGHGRRGGRRQDRGRRDRRREPAQPSPPRERPAPRSERLPRVKDEDLEDALHDALDLLLDFVDVEAEAELYRNDERIEIELYGPDDHILLDDEGQLLLAIEHLLPRMLRGLYGDAFPVRVDCADFHYEREERLREMARQAADEVRRRGKPRTLDELDPAERRIVHLALADDPSVETESVGSGYYKRLKVIPR